MIRQATLPIHRKPSWFEALSCLVRRTRSSLYQPFAHAQSPARRTADRKPGPARILPFPIAPSRTSSALHDPRECTHLPFFQA